MKRAARGPAHKQPVFPVKEFLMKELLLLELPDRARVFTGDHRRSRRPDSLFKRYLVCCEILLDR